MFYQDKQTREAFFEWMDEHKMFFSIFSRFIGYIIAFIICVGITLFFQGCRPAKETTNVSTEIHTQIDTIHTTLNVYDRVEVSDSWKFGSWFVQDSFLAHIRIIDFDTLGRPTRTVDADINRGTAKKQKTSTKKKSSISEKEVIVDSSSIAIVYDEDYEKNQEFVEKIPWWQRTSFRIASAILTAIIAVLIAYLTRHRWQNRILTWLLHRK